jgi:16S rRNA (guanine1207-N2)-methyltransferase
MSKDVYYKKEIVIKDHGHTMRFRVSQDLFSSYQIDVGTRFLLRTIAAETDAATHQKILDLGCGYGPIGLILKKLDEKRIVHMVDRDALAVKYTRQNAELNQLSGVEIYGSLGYDDVTEKEFDLIISNIPGKAGEPVIAHLLRDSIHYLRGGGLVAVVVVSPLESTVAGILESTPNINILFRKNRSGHAVFHYTFTGEKPEPGQTAFERGVYHRDNVTISHHGLTYRMQTAYGLPEFDSLSFHSELMMDEISSLKGSTARRALVFNPGQGHIPVALWKLCKPDDIYLFDRDLLSLRYSKLNLVLNGYPAENINLSHQTGIGLDNLQPLNLIIGVLRESEGTGAIKAVIQHISEQLKPGGTALLAASSTAVTRVVKYIESINKLRIKRREKRKGNSLLVIEHI